jgi:hypothetical protein
MNYYLQHQQIDETFYKELNVTKGNSSIDTEATTKYIVDIVKEEHWKDILEPTIKRCSDEVEESKDNIHAMWLEVYNVTKDECDGVFYAFTICTHLVLALVSKFYLTNSKVLLAI